MLAKAWAERQDMEAAQKLVTSHLRLVAKIAMGFRGYGLPLVDLVSEGNIGLMQAIKRFEPEKGFRLSTYAMWWIKASIQEYILRSWTLVKIGSSAAQKKLFFNLRKLRRQISQANNEIESKALAPKEVTMIATQLGVSEQDVKDMDQRMQSVDQSLNYTVGEDGGEEWGNFLADESANQEALFAENEDKEHRRQLFHRALATLNEREQDILRERRLTETPATLEDLSQKYGISRERVRQIEVRALEKLQEAVA